MMPTHRNEGPVRVRSVWGILVSPWLPVGALAVGCFAIGLTLGGAHPLDAAPLGPGGSGDADGDGLSDLLERVRWTDPFEADTDGDGFGDLEELARHSDPVDAESLPRFAQDGTDVGLAAVVEGGKLKTEIALYSEHGALFDTKFTMGAAIYGMLFELPASVYLADATVTLHRAAGRDARLILVESRMPQEIVGVFNELSLYATLGPLDSPHATTASVLNLSVEGEVVLEYVEPPSWLLPPEVLPSGPISLAVQSAGTGPGTTVGVPPGPGQGGGGRGAGLFRPIAGKGSVPSSWAPNKVCVQLTQVSGGSGPVLTTEVTQASCQDVDDVGCSASSCASKVGTTKEVLDPAALIGG